MFTMMWWVVVPRRLAAAMPWRGARPWFSAPQGHATPSHAGRLRPATTFLLYLFSFFAILAAFCVHIFFCLSSQCLDHICVIVRLAQLRWDNNRGMDCLITFRVHNAVSCALNNISLDVVMLPQNLMSPLDLLL